MTTGTVAMGIGLAIKESVLRLVLLLSVLLLAACSIIISCIHNIVEAGLYPHS